MPKVSIVMPVYNGEQYLPDAIDSIISQSFQDWEMIIVNEFGSNQETTRILADYAARDARIRVIQNASRLYIAESLNVGLRAATGQYIARMDSDDIAGKNRLAEQVRFMDSHSEIDICGTGVEMFGDDCWDWKVYADPQFLRCSCLFYTPFIHPTVMMRSRSLKRYRLEYNPAFHYTEDYDFFCRASQKMKFCNIADKKLYRYRFLRTNATHVGGTKGIELQNAVMRENFKRFGLEFSPKELTLLSPNSYPSAGNSEEALDTLVELDLLLKRVFLCDSIREAYGLKTLFSVLHRRWMDAYEKYRWNQDIMQDERVLRSIERGLFFYEELKGGAHNTKKEAAPKVSIVIPAYNSEEYVLDTVQSLLAQDFTDFEMLIVNEYGSNDNTIKCISLFQDDRIRVLQNKQKLGLADSLNRGFKEARGVYIARADADDVYPPNRLKKQVAYLDAHPEISIIGSWQRHFGKRNYIHMPPAAPEDMKAVLLFKCEVCHSTVMLRREDFAKHDLWYDKTYLSEDYELWTRAAHCLSFATIPEVLGEYRWNGENITESKMDKLDIEAQKIVARSLKENLGLEIPDGDLILLSGWSNPFESWRGNTDALKKREEELIERIAEKNKEVKAYNQDALERVLDERRRWAGIYEAQGEKNASGTSSGAYSGGEMGKSHGQGIGGFPRRILKRLYRPFRYRYENRIIDIRESTFRQENAIRGLQGTVFDVDGHLWDYYSKLDGRINAQSEQINQLLQAIEALSKVGNGLLDAMQAQLAMMEQLLEKKMETRLQNVERLIGERIEARIAKAEQLINQTTDARVCKAEQQICETMDARVWKAEQKINETMDARVWKAEQKINETMDARVWKAEQKINETMDARVWKAEQKINETMDARVWKVEQQICETMDARVWKAEQKINETMDARVWKGEQKINETMDARVWKAESVISDRLDSIQWNMLFDQYMNSRNNESAVTPYYDFSFYVDNRFHSVMSAKEILSMLFAFLPHDSVADFGCGIGSWLWVASNLGTKTITGYDGQYVPESLLMIPGESFEAVDLEKPVAVKMKYDLAMSMEVAEHLSAEAADVFVRTLCNSSDTILFSAAHPGQGGDGHINEQPKEYWVAKFEENGFGVIDISTFFAENNKIEPWYRENIVLFTVKDKVEKLKDALENGSDSHLMEGEL